jgi:hypothetical protein
MDRPFGTWIIRSMYRAGSLMIVAKGISRYIKVKLPMCLNNYALRHEGVWGVDLDIS